jgi:hypothetical protein
MFSQKHKDIIDVVAERVKLHACELLGASTPLKNTVEDITRIIEVCGGELIDDADDGIKYVSLGGGKFQVYYERVNASAKSLARSLGYHFLLDEGNSAPGTTVHCTTYSHKLWNDTNAFGNDYDAEYLYSMAVLYFERAFLLPKGEFVAAVDANTVSENCDVVKLANLFDVSYHLITLRGDDLGIWERRRRVFRKQKDGTVQSLMIQ